MRIFTAAIASATIALVPIAASEPASAAASPSVSSSSLRVAPASLSWSPFWDYTRCIVGVGAPIGVAIVIATQPATWSNLLRWGATQQPSTQEYLNRVFASCSRFIKS